MLTGAVPDGLNAASAVVGKPVAITVTLISSSIWSLNAAPQMMFASSSACSAIIVEAMLISSRLMSGEEVILIITPLAPSIAVSRSGLEIAFEAATFALSLPEALPIPI